MVLGDNGEVDFDTLTVPGTALVKTIASEPTGFDGVDEIIVGDGEDFVIAGGEGDRVNYTLDAGGEPVQIADGDDAADYVIGDYGQALFDTTTGESVIDFIETIAPEHGGDDFIFVDEGPDVVLGGSGMDVVHAGVGDFSDVVLGDNGEVDFDTLTVPGTALVETVTSTATGLGGVDEIVTGDGADYVIAGVGDDKVNVGVTAPDFGDDVVIGDNGHVEFDTTTGESVIDFIETIAPEHGGDDLIFVGEGADVVLGGSGMDVVHAGVGDFSDVVLGDNGEVDFDTTTVPGTALVKTIASEPTGFDGVDEIIVGDGEDFVIAGGEGDRVNYTLDADGEPVQIADGDDAADYVIGDYGQALFDTTTGESVIDFIETIAPEHGGDDLIFVDEGPDVVLGGSGMDVVHAGVGDFSDVVLGDNGEVDFDTLTVPGTALVETVTSTATGLGGVDEIVTGDGADYVIAGVGDDKVNVGVTAPDFGDDVVIGDNGHVEFDTTTGESVIDFIETIAPEHGGDDLIFVGEGADVVLGGSGMDVVHAGVGDFSDVVLGDNGEVDFDTLTVPGTALVKTIASEPTGFDGVDEIIVGDGEDFVIAGGEGDRVNYTLDADGEPVQIADGDDAADYVIGDYGQALFDTTTGESVIDFIETIAPEHGGDDLIFVDEGPDVVLGGSGMDVVHAGVGDFSDVVLGDNGEVDFDTTTVPGTALVETVTSTATGLGGVDEIVTGDGEDFVIAGGEGDRVNYTLDADGEPVQIADGDDAADYVIGDYGQALFDTTTGESVIDFIETIAPEHGGDDLIFVGEGADVVLGGSGMDVVHAGVGDFSDVVLGDNGEVDFDTTTVPGTALVKTIASEPTGFDGVDEIVTGDGEDFVIAGGEGDRVNYTLDADGEPVQIADGDDAADYVIGDYGQALFDTTTGESVIDFIETIAPEHGGDDLIFVDEGNDVVLGGSGSDVVHAGVGDFSDVVLGDNGEVDFDTTTVPGTALVKTIASEPTGFDGVDEIIVGDGEDFVIAGGEGDRVNYTLDADGEPVQIADGDDAADYVIGDYGQALFDTTTGESVIDFIETIAPEHGGDDLIFVGEGADVVLGGSGMDVVHAGVGDFSDVVLGDNGEVDFDTTTVPGTALVKTIASEPTGFDGVDEIIVGDGEDFVIAGGEGDRVNYTLDADGEPVQIADGDDAADYVIGDYGQALFDTTTGESVIDFIETIAPEHGGDDLIFVDEGADVVLGGSGMDVVHAGVGDFSDVVLGDNGEVDFDTLTVPGTALVETVTSTATGLGGVDEIVTGDGADYVIAGVGADRVNYILDPTTGEPVQVGGDDAADYVVGDNGQALFDTTTGESVIDFIETIAPEHGGDDLIFVDEGNDVVLGGSGMDVVHAGVGDFSDVVLGDNGEVDFDTLTVPGTALVETVTSTATGLGGVDEIIVGDGEDFVIAGGGVTESSTHWMPMVSRFSADW